MMTHEQLDEQLCRQCRGRCCQGHPGLWSDPARFFAIFGDGDPPAADRLAGILDREALDLRDLGGILVPAPPETDRGCAALGEQGCAYGTDRRPCQCLALVPELETLLDDRIHCTLPPAYGSGTARANWRPYQELLREAAARRRNATA